ncbi:hypothetical protein FOB72_16555 [Cupriavidus pauculus]|uniref:Endopeptidase n=1 Tax=Cupriavidus pauculus TaxID=82633 RepID=A0A5P2H715_9BURK|nr:hypothetical protein FOB72_16555 [Cupriavidus pauculus]
MFARPSLKTLLASLLVTAALAACGGDDAPSTPANPNQPANPPAAGQPNPTPPTKSCAPD